MTEYIYVVLLTILPVASIYTHIVLCLFMEQPSLHGKIVQSDPLNSNSRK